MTVAGTEVLEAENQLWIHRILSSAGQSERMQLDILPFTLIRGVCGFDVRAATF